MRNITFDESLVMREFARIAGEQGLIKTAQTPPVGGLNQPVAMTPEAQKLQQNAQQTQQQQQKLQQFSPMLKDLQQTIGGQKADDLDSLLPRPKSVPDVSLEPKKDISVDMPIPSWQTETNKSTKLTDIEKADVIRLLGPGSVEAPDFNQRMDHIKAKDPDLYEKTLLPVIQNKMSKKISSRKTASVSSVYDVSGETGENLIDSAHPGNMHTEVSGRKDDEGNLVETIVEQHEADKEVAHSIPKGTYATLRTLQDKLNKLGHTDILPELEEVIKLVATPKEVIAYELTTLANKLDQKGFIEVASKVDVLTKKAIESETYPGNPYLPFTPTESPFRKSGPMSYMPGKEPTWPPGQPQTTQPEFMMGEKAPAFDIGVQTLGKGGTPAVQQWQQKYNARHGLKAGVAGWLKDDGVWGPNTQKAYELEKIQKTPAYTAKEKEQLDKSDYLDKKKIQQAPTAAPGEVTIKTPGEVPVDYKGVPQGMAPPALPGGAVMSGPMAARENVRK